VAHLKASRESFRKLLHFRRCRRIADGKLVESFERLDQMTTTVRKDLAHGFGLRLGERKSEAEAERRTERSRSRTTGAVVRGFGRTAAGALEQNARWTRRNRP